MITMQGLLANHIHKACNLYKIVEFDKSDGPKKPLISMSLLSYVLEPANGTILGKIHTNFQ